MSDPAGPQTIREALDEIRNAGRVPLGVLSYDVAQEDFSLYLCPDVVLVGSERAPRQARPAIQRA
jgi:hypothetical protein